VIDLRGRLAIPGFIDNHTHFISGGLQLSRVQLRDTSSSGEFARRIAEHASRLGEGEWVVGWGWDEQSWQPYRLPDRALIDGVENPVFVSRLDAHMAVANSRALQLAGITRGTADPPGGTIVRDASGEPTGLLKDTAMALVSKVIPPPSADERLRAARAALAEAARFGVTSLCDMSWPSDFTGDLRAYQQLDREGALTARIYLFAPVAQHARLSAAGIEKRFGSDKLRIGALKGFADGSLGSSTAAFYEPYADDPETRGLTMAEMTDGSMAAWVADADEHDLQIAIHAIGDRANDDVLSIFESRPRCAERRFRIEHAQHLNPSLIARFAASGVIAAMQPAHAVDDGRWADARIGRERARHAYAFRSLLDAGAVVTFGSDWSVAPLDPLVGLHAAVARRWNREQTISVEEALRCYTVNNAWAMFAEHEVGRIAPGLLADIVVLSGNLFENLEDVRVELTIFDGKIIYGEA
jgi:predicted amidohydrolase YtcJ